MHESRPALTYNDVDEQLSLQLDLVANLHKLVSRQQTILLEGRVDEIASLNYAKSALLTAMRSKIATLEELQQAWQAMQSRVTEPQRQRIDQKVQRLRAMVDEVLSKERQSEQQIHQVRRAKLAGREGHWNTSIVRLEPGA